MFKTKQKYHPAKSSIHILKFSISRIHHISKHNFNYISKVSFESVVGEIKYNFFCFSALVFSIHKNYASCMTSLYLMNFKKWTSQPFNRFIFCFFLSWGWIVTRRVHSSILLQNWGSFAFDTSIKNNGWCDLDNFLIVAGVFLMVLDDMILTNNNIRPLHLYIYIYIYFKLK